MNKEALKLLYGQYCDTDKLVNDIMALLTKYHHNNTEYGVCTMLDEYFANKRSLIELFSSSNNYAGDMRIILDVELERGNDRREINNFCYRFDKAVGAEKHLLKYTDVDGKKMGDYIKTGIKSVNIKDLENSEIMNKLIACSNNLNQFRSDGTTKESYTNYVNFVNSICNNGMRYISHAQLDEEDVRVLNENVDYKLAAGMKTSRAFNKICTYYKINECAQYNKLFAQYADMVSGLKRKLKFFISVNPLDYLTMSFGNSWASCHTIDKRNVRNMPDNYSGAYCGGTLSYMLDGTSFITYVHTNIPDDIEEGKLYRNMFHYNEHLLIQSRIYPQGNDGNTDLYQVFRGFVQKEFADLLKLNSNIWVKSNRSINNIASSQGVHYRDYHSFSGCNYSFPKECTTGSIVPIGHEGICVCCGREYSTSSGLTCPNCR